MVGTRTLVAYHVDDHRKNDEAFAVVCRDGCSGKGVTAAATCPFAGLLELTHIGWTRLGI
jgi:hypothetical protein